MQVLGHVGSSWLSLGWDPAVTRCSGADCSLDVHCSDLRRRKAPAPDLVTVRWHRRRILERLELAWFRQPSATRFQHDEGPGDPFAHLGDEVDDVSAEPAASVSRVSNEDHSCRAADDRVCQQAEVLVLGHQNPGLVTGTCQDDGVLRTSIRLGHSCHIVSGLSKRRHDGVVAAFVSEESHGPTPSARYPGARPLRGRWCRPRSASPPEGPVV
jgi:hypothetical protein